MAIYVFFDFFCRLSFRLIFVLVVAVRTINLMVDRCTRVRLHDLTYYEKSIFPFNKN